jgi:DNA-binding transcriptional regulator YhcF (GntR family)
MGRFWIENELVDKYISKLTGNEFKVMVIITRHFNKNGTCYPSIRRMATLGNINPETVSKCLKNLNLLGFLEQLEIKERCKLRYILSKSARHLLIDSNKLPQETSGKEEKEDLRKTLSFKKNTIGLDMDGREVFISNGKKCVKNSDGKFYDFYGEIKTYNPDYLIK